MDERTIYIITAHKTKDAEIHTAAEIAITQRVTATAVALLDTYAVYYLCSTLVGSFKIVASRHLLAYLRTTVRG